MDDLKPAPDAIDVWHLDLTAAAADAAVLREDERQRAERIRIPDRRVQFVAGRASMRRILAGYLRVDPADVEFEYGTHGKPALAGADLAFNLSHSHDRGLLAVASGADLRLGIDVEHARPGRRFEGIARRFFAPPESEALLALPPDAVPAAFYRAWALKEAYLKAWGTGLSFPSNRFCLTFPPTGRPRLLTSEMPGEDPATLASWQLTPLAVDGTFAAALCYQGEPRWIRHVAPPGATGTPGAAS